MLKSVVICGSNCHFSEHTRNHEITKNTNTTVKGHVDELVSPRTMGHLIEKKYQVTIWSIMVTICAQSIFCGVQNCISEECAMVE